MTSTMSRESTARARELGGELRRLRERSGQNATDLARTLGWSPSTISRLESGTRATSEVHVAIYLASCGLSRVDMEHYLDLARAGDDGYWLRPHGGRLPDELRSLIIQENLAASIASYEPLLIPGLLQTEGYARGLFRWFGRASEQDVELKVAARLQRQDLLRKRRPPKVTFYLHEQALTANVGGPQAMHEQLLHLVLVTGRPDCEVRIVPHSAGPHGVLGSGFRRMRYVEHPPVVYVENLTSSVFLEDRADIAAYDEILAKLAEIALDGGHSREWLARLASERERAEEPAHDRGCAHDLAQEQLQRHR